MAEQTSGNGRPPIHKVIFKTNELQTVALAFDGDGLHIPASKVGYSDQVLFSLVDGRRMYVPKFPADKIKELGVRRGEEFQIGKVEVFEKQRRFVRWKVERPPEPETPLARDIRASLPIAQAKKAGDPRSSVEIARDLKRPAEPLPPEWDGLIGSEEASRQPERSSSAAASASISGPMSKPAVSNGHTSNPPTKIPYNVAVREILSIVVGALKEAGEQWSDAAKQDLVSTLIISASRDGYLRCWERP